MMMALSLRTVYTSSTSTRWVWSVAMTTTIHTPTQAEGNKRWYDPKVYLSELSRKEDITRRGSKSLGPSRNLSVSDVSFSGSSMVARSFKEYIQLSTLTCSTKLTQKSEWAGLRAVVCIVWVAIFDGMYPILFLKHVIL